MHEHDSHTFQSVSPFHATYCLQTAERLSQLWCMQSRRQHATLNLLQSLIVFRPHLLKYFTMWYAQKALHLHYLQVDSEKGRQYTRWQQYHNPMASPR